MAKAEIFDCGGKSAVILVCETCKEVVGVIRRGGIFDHIIANYRVLGHTGHRIISVYKQPQGNYRAVDGVSFRIDYIQ